MGPEPGKFGNIGTVNPSLTTNIIATMKKETLLEEVDQLSRFEEEGGLEIPAPELVAVTIDGTTTKHFRRLKQNELVSVGDFVSDNHEGFEPWVGPSGFQAGSFVKPIYRQTRAKIASR